MPGGDDLDDGLALDASLVDDTSDPPSPAAVPLDEEDTFELEGELTKRSPPAQ